MTALATGSLLAGKYRIARVLGEGGMGAVYLAENIDIGRRVAIKVLHAELGRNDDVMQRFRREARASATIGHPNIVDVLDMGTTPEGEAFIVMEALDGQTLAARQKARGKLPVPEIVAILVEVLDGLAAAHAKGFIHRDLKPENLMLTWRPKWGVKILDFGISRVVGPDELSLTASNVVMGTVLYMAPEQAKDARSAGVPADLYAIGSILYHLLLGVPPFVGSTYTEVLSKLLVEPPPPLPPSVPPPLTAMVEALLAKDPMKRPTSALAVRDALRALVPGALPVPVEPTATPTPAAFDPLAATAASEPGRDAGLEATVDSEAPIARHATVATELPSRPPAPVRSDAPTTARAPRRVGAMIGALVALGGGVATVVAVTRSSGTSAPRDARAIDARPVDATAPDAPPPDAAPVAASPPDAAPLDAATRDAGTKRQPTTPMTVSRDAAGPRDAPEAVKPPPDAFLMQVPGT